MTDPKTERAKRDFANLLAPSLRPLFGSNNLNVDIVNSRSNSGDLSTTFRIMVDGKRAASIVSQYVEVDGKPVAHAVVKFGDGPDAIRAAYPINQVGGIDQYNPPKLIDANGKILSEREAMRVPRLTIDKAHKIIDAATNPSVPNPHYSPATTGLPATLSLGNFLSRYDEISGRVKTAATTSRPQAAV